MDAFNFCWVTLLDESKRYSVFFDKDTCNVKNEMDENFSKPVKRISYLYKFGGYNISFFYQCFKEFFSEVPDSSKIIDNFLSIKNPTICSISSGPGTDIIGFLYSLHLIKKPLVNTTAFKFINKQTSWGNVITEMMKSSSISVPDQSTCKFTACDFLKDLSRKAQRYLKAADILLMCNPFPISVSPEIVSHSLQNVIRLLKSGALVFIIFDKEKSTYFKELNSFGSFLFGPIEVSLEDMPYNEKIAEIVGVKPVCSGSSLFAVWQKINEIRCEINFHEQLESNLTVGSSKHSSTELTISKNDIKDINYPIWNISNLKTELSSDANVSSHDSIASSSGFSSSSISSQSIKTKHESIVPDNAINFNVQNKTIGLPGIHFKSSPKNVSSISLNASDSLEGKKCASPCKSGQKNIKNKGKNINSILKKFESLVTKFEGLTSSDDLLRNSYVKDNLQIVNNTLLICVQVI